MQRDAGIFLSKQSCKDLKFEADFGTFLGKQPPRNIAFAKTGYLLYEMNAEAYAIEVQRGSSATQDDSMGAQADLFTSDSERLTIDESFSTVKRVALDATSWVDIVPTWVRGSRSLFDRLLCEVEWSQRERLLFDQTVQEPRLTGEYKNLETVGNKSLLQITAALSRHYGTCYDSLWLNLYRTGEDSTAWHRDRFSCRRLISIVPVLSLGATRRFLIKPRSGGASISFRPGSGDLIVMGGRAQDDWVHSVPKELGYRQPRISINFQSSAQRTAER